MQYANTFNIAVANQSQHRPICRKRIYVLVNIQLKILTKKYFVIQSRCIFLKQTSELEKIKLLPFYSFLVRNSLLSFYLKKEITLHNA